MSWCRLRRIGLLPRFGSRRPDGGKRLKQHKRLVENGASIGIDEARHAPVTCAVKSDQGVMHLGHALARVFRERARAGDFPFDAAEVVFESSGLSVDCDGDSEFFASSSLR